ncbi:MAG: hypothetical protein QXG25_06065, partial [Nitrososphaerota archaeon]
MGYRHAILGDDLDGLDLPRLFILIADESRQQPLLGARDHHLNLPKLSERYALSISLTSSTPNS